MRKNLDLEIDSSNQTRLSLWNKSVSMWRDNPINGVGVGNFQRVFENKYSDSHSGSTVNAHNNFMHFAAETGTLGVVAFTWFIFSLLKYLYLSYQKIEWNHNWNLFILSSFLAAVVFNIQGLANVNFVEDTSIKFFWFWLALNVTLVDFESNEYQIKK